MYQSAQVLEGRKSPKTYKANPANKTSSRREEPSPSLWRRSKEVTHSDATDSGEAVESVEDAMLWASGKGAVGKAANLVRLCFMGGTEPLQ